MEILVKRAVDRSKYPHRLIFVDKQGNVCVADRPQPMSAEEKAERQAARDEGKKAFRDEKAGLKKAMHEAKAIARKSLNPLDAEGYAAAKAEYDNFRKG